ncbi:MAG TPA: hypothetical protein VIB78_13140 [Acidimicrobiia bacterium]|jgi:hypothetical protein
MKLTVANLEPDQAQHYSLSVSDLATGVGSLDVLFVDYANPIPSYHWRADPGGVTLPVDLALSYRGIPLYVQIGLTDREINACVDRRSVPDSLGWPAFDVDAQTGDLVYDDNRMKVCFCRTEGGAMRVSLGGDWEAAVRRIGRPEFWFELDSADSLVGFLIASLSDEQWAAIRASAVNR